MSNEEIKKTVKDLATAWESFKDTNENRLVALENNQGTAELDEQLNKINASIDGFQNALNQSDEAAKKRTDEIERKVNQLHTGAVADGGKTADLTKSAQLFYAARTSKALSELGEVDTKEYQEYRDAFASFLRFHPDAKPLQKQEIKAALSVGSDRDGGYWVPTEVSSQIIKRLFETSPIRNIASVISITTDAIELPNDTNLASSGGWVAETGSRGETNTPQVGMQRLTVHEQFAQPKVTQKLLDDAAIDVEGWLSAKIAEILSFTENAAFVSGNGVGKPRGFLDYGATALTTKDSSRAWGKLQYVPSGAPGAFPTVSGLVSDDANCLIDIIYALKPAYRAGATWVANRATVAAVRKLRDANGHYFWAPGLQAGQPSTLLNYGITEAEDMPDMVSDALAMAFGNFSVGYTIVDRQGIRVLRDPFTDKPFVKFYTTKRVGGDVVNFDAIKLLKFANS